MTRRQAKRRVASNQKQQSSCEANISPGSQVPNYHSTSEMSRPKVLIWRSKKKTLGHIALLTDLFYISFWPFTRKIFTHAVKSTVGGRLHFHMKEDKKNEDNREPTLYEIFNVTNEEINKKYIKCLEYNKIDPEEVSLAAAERKSECLVDLTRTGYYFAANIIIDKRKERNYSDYTFFLKRFTTPGWQNNTFCPDCKNQSERVECLFYHKPQSCVSFCFNLIEMADPKPLVCLVEARKKTRTISFAGLLYSLLGMCLEITVTNFEEHVVKKYWLEGCKREHYNVLDFQKRTLFLMLFENVFKNALLMFPTIVALQFCLQWLQVTFPSWPCYVLGLVLFALTPFILLVYFAFFYCIRVKVFPTFHLKKNVVLIGGGILLLYMMILLLIFQSVYLILWIPITNFFIFFLYVLIYRYFIVKYFDRY